jgi:hypothetical protein
LLVNDCELFRGPAPGEIAELAEHFFPVVDFLGEIKVFDIGIRARVVPVSVELRAVVFVQLVVGVVSGVTPCVHGGHVGKRFSEAPR